MLLPTSVSLIALAGVALASSRTPSLKAHDPTTHPKSLPVTVSRSSDSEGFGFTNVEQSLYTATVYVNGVPYQVQLDTGSSDTWLDPLSAGVSLPPGLIYTGINSTTRYVDGSVSTGPIVLANVTFGPYTVYNQAITLSYNGTGQTANVTNGLIGLAGYSQDSSSIYTLLKNTSYVENGIPIVYNIFEHEPNLPDYTAFLFSRSTGSISDGGILTVSEVLSNMTEVLDMPRFEAVLPDFWNTFMDGVYVNGKLINGGSQYENSSSVSLPPGSTIANFDSGTSLIRGPAKYAHAIYGDVPGVQLLPDDGSGVVMYTVPCDTKLNLTWSFGGGHLYSMHPIDAISFQFDSSTGQFACVGTISGGPIGDEDWLLGDSFLRNAYIVYGYGSPTATGSASNNLPAKKPYSQLLSLTNPDKAWAEFDTMLLKAILSHENDYVSTLSAAPSSATLPVFSGSRPTVTVTEIWTTGQNAAATGTVSASSSSVTDALAAVDTGSDRVAGALSFDSESDASSSKVDLSPLTRNTYIILGLLAGVVLLLLVVVVLTVRASRENKGYRSVPATSFAARDKALGASEGESLYSTPYSEGGQ
ncbi:aspartic peptidase domain-containing protein [Trametes meyenii]|nr:aspartic peptidase domain-containing protein [Trametes meyenii]